MDHWQDAEDIAIALGETLPRHRPLDGALHRSAPVGHRAATGSPTTRRPPTKGTLEAIQMAWLEEYRGTGERQRALPGDDGNPASKTEVEQLGGADRQALDRSEGRAVLRAAVDRRPGSGVGEPGRRPRASDDRRPRACRAAAPGRRITARRRRPCCAGVRDSVCRRCRHAASEDEEAAAAGGAARRSPRVDRHAARGPIGVPVRRRSGSRSVSTWNGDAELLERRPEPGDVVAVHQVVGVGVEQMDAPAPTSTIVTVVLARHHAEGDAHGLVRAVRDARIHRRSTTRTGVGSVVRPCRARAGSVQRDEAIGAVDQVGQHDQTAVGAPSRRDSGRRRFWQP